MKNPLIRTYALVCGLTDDGGVRVAWVTVTDFPPQTTVTGTMPRGSWAGTYPTAGLRLACAFLSLLLLLEPRADTNRRYSFPLDNLPVFWVVY